MDRRRIAREPGVVLRVDGQIGGCCELLQYRYDGLTRLAVTLHHDDEPVRQRRLAHVADRTLCPVGDR